MSAQLFDLPAAEAPEVEAETKVSTRARPRPRRPNVSGKEQDIADRVKRFYDADLMDRTDDFEARIQRHAKMNQWREGQDCESDFSDVTLGDIRSRVLRFEDILQNAVLSTRPIVTSKSIIKEDEQREDRVDMLQDYQFFRENEGEKLVEACSTDFIVDGSFKVYTRWVVEKRNHTVVRHFKKIPVGIEPQAYFSRLIEKSLALPEFRPTPDGDGWDFKGTRDKKNWFDIRFYTEDGEDSDIVMEIAGDMVSFDAPIHVRYPYEDVMYPYWCENLQAPCQSNPRGATHVILVDHPTVDEVKRLIRSGEYNLLELGDVEGVSANSSYVDQSAHHSLEREKEVMRGFTPESATVTSEDPHHGTIKRLTCFDVWAESEDSEPIDVVWEVLLGGVDKLARARPLGEVAPGNPPRRPLSHAAMIPIPGRVDGVGIPELMEGIYDLKKEWFDKMLDGAEFEIRPVFTYRMSSMVKPEEYEWEPGTGLPVSQNGDITPVQVNPQSGAVGINVISLLDRMQDDLTMVGDLQLGRIPAGKSSALRTSGGISQVLAQGEARPERMLRRFFMGLRQMFAHQWRLNQAFLTEEKEFRVLGIPRRKGELVKVERADLAEGMEFDFEANVLNASKVAMQQAMETVLGVLLNPLALQLGISDGESIYRLLIDYLRSLGQQPEKYLREPVPGSSEPKIPAYMAVNWLYMGMMPEGQPEEGAVAHLEQVQELLQRKGADGMTVAQHFSPESVQLTRQYMQRVSQLAQEEQRQQQLQAAASQLQTQLTQGGGQGATGPQGPSQAPIVERGDVVDDTLPASGTPQ